MQDYKPNSHRFKEEQKKAAVEEKKIEKVVSGGAAKVKKKSELQKFTKAFISEDVSSVKSHVISDVIIPAAKKLIYDIVKDGIDMLLYGASGGGSTRNTTGSKVSYSKMYDDPRDRRGNQTSSKTRFDFDDIIFPSRGVAEAVLVQMQEVIDRYGFVTVADMYDMADITQPYTSNKYGWINVSTAEVSRVRDGYIIKLPRAVPLD